MIHPTRVEGRADAVVVGFFFNFIWFSKGQTRVRNDVCSSLCVCVCVCACVPCVLLFCQLLFVGVSLHHVRPVDCCEIKALCSACSLDVESLSIQHKFVA